MQTKQLHHRHPRRYPSSDSG